MAKLPKTAIESFKDKPYEFPEFEFDLSGYIPDSMTTGGTYTITDSSYTPTIGTTTADPTTAEPYAIPVPEVAEGTVISMELHDKGCDCLICNYAEEYAQRLIAEQTNDYLELLEAVLDGELEPEELRALLGK